MPGRQTIPWPEIHELLLAVGAVREPRTFCVRAVRELARLVPQVQLDGVPGGIRVVLTGAVAQPRRAAERSA